MNPINDAISHWPRRTAILLAILLPTTLIAYRLTWQQKRLPWQGQVAQQAIPALLMINQELWSSLDRPLSETEMQILETRDYLLRQYSDPHGRAIDLCIIFSEDNRKGTHPPDVCLQGSGAQIQAAYDREIPIDPQTSLRVHELLVTQGLEKVYYCYFYKCGHVFTPNFYRQQARILWNGLTQRDASGALIRFNTPLPPDGSMTQARQRIDTMIRTLYPILRDRLESHG